MSKHFSVTASGAVVDFVEPAPEQMRIEDIAHALAVMPRFTGHTLWERDGFAYSGAQHSVHVAEVVGRLGGTPREQLGGLLHDGSEAVLCDLSTLAKSLCPGYVGAELRVQRCIYQRFGLPAEWADHKPDLVTRADAIMLATEAQHLCHPAIHKYLLMHLATGPIIEPWPPRVAKRRFLMTFYAIAAVLNDNGS